jgi:hypothetical protein
MFLRIPKYLFALLIIPSAAEAFPITTTTYDSSTNTYYYVLTNAEPFQIQSTQVGAVYTFIVDGGGFGTPITPTFDVTFLAPRDLSYSVSANYCLPDPDSNSLQCFVYLAFSPTSIGQHCQKILAHMHYSEPFPDAPPPRQPGVDTKSTVTFCGMGLPPAPTPTPTPTPVPSCALNLDLSQSEIMPALTDGNNTAIVSAAIECTNQSDAVGKSIEFISDPVFESGGHAHGGERPTGIFSSPTCTTNADGKCEVIYTASEVAGIEIISAFSSATSSVAPKKELFVRVPNLVEIKPSSVYRLTGQTTSHPENHFLSSSVLSKFLSFTIVFNEEFNATLGFNDMSLEQGGLFDIGGNYGSFWATPHKSHRKGTSVDIDQCALSSMAGNSNPQGTCPTGWVAISRRQIQKLCAKAGGALVIEEPYHCEFKGR